MEFVKRLAIFHALIAVLDKSIINKRKKMK